MLRSLIKILRASLVQTDTEMAEKYAKQRYAVRRFVSIYGLLCVAGVDHLALSIDRLYNCKLLLRRSPKWANNCFSATKF